MMRRLFGKQPYNFKTHTDLNIWMDANEDYAWLNCNEEHLWLFDKLLLSHRLGYNCGPVGVRVPTPGHYIVRPITNIRGMGIDTQRVYLEEDTEHLPSGHFWCEEFTGRHFSIDYYKGHQQLCVEGFRDDIHTYYKWARWERCDFHIQLPFIIKPLANYYPIINCEYIGYNLIEVHLRHNPDFVDGVDVMIPVWEGDSIEPPPGMIFVDSPDYKRLGFFIRQTTTL